MGVPTLQKSNTTMSAPAKKTGHCKWFNAKKGFGFITRDDEEEDVFVHQTGIHAEGFRSLLENEKVEFNLTEDDQGRLKAIDVTGPEGAYVKGAPKPGQRRNRRRRRNRPANNENAEEEPEQQNEVAEEETTENPEAEN